MILYRVESNNLNTEFGINTFNYQNEEKYIHFYILPEHADILQIHKYYINNIDSYILKCNIPYKLLEFGIGLYNVNNYKKIPFLEARVKLKDFKKEYLIEKQNMVLATWYDSNIFERYLINCVYNKCFYFIDKKNDIIKLNNNFNFLYYFKKDDLERENIKVDNYPIIKDYNVLKKEYLSFLKRIYVNVLEYLELEDKFLTR